jgi:hypothetical protein
MRLRPAYAISNRTPILSSAKISHAGRPIWQMYPLFGIFCRRSQETGWRPLPGEMRVKSPAGIMAVCWRGLVLDPGRDHHVGFVFLIVVGLYQRFDKLKVFIGGSDKADANLKLAGFIPFAINYLALDFYLMLI